MNIWIFGNLTVAFPGVHHGEIMVGILIGINWDGKEWNIMEYRDNVLGCFGMFCRDLPEKRAFSGVDLQATLSSDLKM